MRQTMVIFICCKADVLQIPCFLNKIVANGKIISDFQLFNVLKVSEFNILFYQLLIFITNSISASRLEEREADQKAEFDKLHDRYNVLLRTHIDHMERTKYLMGSDKFELMQNMPLPSYHLRNKLVFQLVLNF